MSETQTAAAAADFNPFDPESFKQGGGLWDGKTVTITDAVCKAEALKHKDGSQVVDAKTKEPVILTALFLKGIAEGGDDRERHEEYSVGDSLIPTPDGEGFVDKATGQTGRFHANSNMGKLAAALKASGFPIETLIVRNADGSIKQVLKKLIGARFVMKAEAKVGKDGKPIKDAKGYTKNAHYPVKFVGYAQGGTQTGVQASVPGGNGDALKAKAAGAVLTALAGGPLSRAQLVQTLAKNLQGDPDSNAIIGMVVRDDFHKGQPWKYDGTQASL